MNPVLALDDGLLVPVIAIGGSFAVAIFGIIFWAVKSIFETRSREETKRELAAYVAEGSVSPDDAERMIKADMPHWEKGRKA